MSTSKVEKYLKIKMVMPEDACEEDIPYFRNMDMEQICCIGCGKFVSIEPITGKPETIQNIRLNGEQLC